MLIIRAENSRYSYDDFIIEDVDDLDELQWLVEEQQPLKVLFIPRFYQKNIIVSDTLSYELVYLNNYNRIYDITAHVIDRKEFRALMRNQCTKCEHEHYDHGINCMYQPDQNNQCVNYEEEIKLIDHIKGLFKRGDKD